MAAADRPAEHTKFNAAIAAFQGLNGLKPDGLVNPGGPTLAALNRKLPLAAATETTPPARVAEAAVLNQRPETLPGPRHHRPRHGR